MASRLLLLVAMALPAAMAQIGTTLCACQPDTVTFDLSFSLDCDDSNVEGPGINQTACLVETRGDEDTENPFPTVVSEVQILELDQNLQVVGQSFFTDTYFDGDSITYTSIVKTAPETIDEVTLPRGFQVSITGLNAEEETLVNTWVIIYTNDCGIFPLLEVGEQIGWSVIVRPILLFAVLSF